jgi:type IV pilus assembly protein PilQ
MTTRRLLIVALCVLSTAVIHGQSDPAAGGASGTVSVSDNKDLISVDFPNEEIRVVLRNVADLFELNLVVPEALVGRTSVKLRNVTWRQIFEVVLAEQNYTYLEEGNIIKIVSRDQLALEPTTTEVFVLNYSRASEILPTVSAMVDTSETVKGRIQVDARNNALVITERPTQLKKIKPVIDLLDVATAQVVIETKFIEVTNNNASDIGVNWSSLSNYKIGTTGPVENTVTDTTAVGNSLNRLFKEPGALSATFSADEFSILLSLLEGQENVRLVSNPTVVTLNNVLAKINVGEEFPIPNYTYNQERGNFEISGFTYKAIGIILNVTPQVNNAGFIKLTITPEVSSRTGTVNFGGASGASIPIIAVRKTETQVSLKNGHTMGIGGLIEATTTKGKSRVPVFGELPLVGGLFRSKNDSSSSRNLVVFITAKTLDNETPAVEEIFDSQVIRNMELKREDMPGHRSPGSAFQN